MFTKLDSSGDDRESSTTEMLTLRLPVTGGLIRLSYLDIIIIIFIEHNCCKMPYLPYAGGVPCYSLLVLSAAHYNQFHCWLLRPSDAAMGQCNWK